MKTLINLLVCTILCVTASGAGQAYSNGSGLFDFHASDTAYRELLSASVYLGYKDLAPVSYAELPAFGPEAGFWLCPDEDGYFLVWSEATTNLNRWAYSTTSNDQEPRSIGRTTQELVALTAKEGLVRFYERKIPKEIGAKIEHQWKAVLFSERPQLEPIGDDGVTVILGASDSTSNQVFWSIWCPRPGSAAAKLMQLAHAIRKLAVENASADVETVLNDITKQPSPSAPAQ